MKHFLRLFSVICLLSSASATEVTDLGQGLGYLRVHQLDQAIKPLAGSGALVLDLRHVTTAPETVTMFASALSDRDAGSSLFVLVGPDTPVDFAATLKGNLVTLGIKGSHPEPRVVVDQTAADDHKAYDALESGTALAQLTSGKIEKDRFDEATLVHEFKNGNHDAQPPAPPAATGTSATPTLSAPLTDRVLQRAVHLHRALLALKR